MEQCPFDAFWVQLGNFRVGGEPAVVRRRRGVWGCGFGGGCASAGRRLGYVSGLRKRHHATLSGQAPIVAPRSFRTSRGLFAELRDSLARRAASGPTAAHLPQPSAFATRC